MHEDRCIRENNMQTHASMHSHKLIHAHTSSPVWHLHPKSPRSQFRLVEPNFTQNVESPHKLTNLPTLHHRPKTPRLHSPRTKHVVSSYECRHTEGHTYIYPTCMYIQTARKQIHARLLHIFTQKHPVYNLSGPNYMYTQTINKNTYMYKHTRTKFSVSHIHVQAHINTNSHGDIRIKNNPSTIFSDQTAYLYTCRLTMHTFT